MAKKITKIVLTGGPAAGKTTLISRILHEFKQEDGWRVITIPETATELISGFGIRPFGGCMSMLAFQDFVVADQIHKEKLALEAAQVVDEENILIIYDRALMDDKAYISDEEFAQVIARFDGRTESGVLANYDAVLHLVTCAKGAEFAYNLGNTARTESLESAREMDDRTLRAWSGHPNLHIIDNSVNFEEKMNRAIREIYRILGEPEPMIEKRKFLVAMPDLEVLSRQHNALTLDAGHQPQRGAPHPPAGQRQRLPLLLHREAHHGRRHQVEHGEAHLRKELHPLPDGGRQRPAQRAQDQIPLHLPGLPPGAGCLSLQQGPGHALRLLRQRRRSPAPGVRGDPGGHRRPGLQEPPAGPDPGAVI